MYAFSDDGEEDERTTPTRSTTAAAPRAGSSSHRSSPPPNGRRGDAMRNESFGFDMDDEDDEGVRSSADPSAAQRIRPPRESASASRSASVASGAAFGAGAGMSSRSPELPGLGSRSSALPSDPTMAEMPGVSDIARGPPRRAPAIDRLQHLWVQERCSPEMLSWSGAPGAGGARCDEVVDEVCAQLEQQVVSGRLSRPLQACMLAR